MKKNYFTYVLLAVGGYILFSSFRKKSATGTVYVGQSNAPTGTTQVYSRVGTKLYDMNGNTIYTYDTANIGMTVTGDYPSAYSVVLGSDFANGIAGYVSKDDVNTI